MRKPPRMRDNGLKILKTKGYHNHSSVCHPFVFIQSEIGRVKPYVSVRLPNDTSVLSVMLGKAYYHLTSV